MTNEEIIEELLIEANELGIRKDVLELSKKILETNPKIDRVSSVELAFKLSKGALKKN
jgi:hypothetical protein